MSFRERVAEHYRSRGYQVRESVKVRGTSGGVYAVDMVAQGALGNILVTFGGLDGVDEADLAQVKRTARDVGAVAVAASESFDPVVRRTAQREGIVLLDRDLPQAEQEETVDWPSPDEDARRVAEDHPWPSSGRAGDPSRTALRSVALDDLLSEGADAPEPAPAPTQAPVRKAPTQEAPAPRQRFAWLPNAANAAPQQGGATMQAPRPASPALDDSDIRESHTATGRPIDRPAQGTRDEVLRDVRARVDRVTGAVEHTSRVATRQAPRSPSVLRVEREATARWAILAVLGGAVAGIVVWLLLRFGP